MLAVVKSEAEDDSAVQQDAVHVKQEHPDHKSENELIIELYADHQVKEEMVIGPVVLQKPVPSAELVVRDVTANSSMVTYQCRSGLCDQNISSSSSLIQHDCTHTSNTSSCDVEEKGEQTATKFTCDICKGDFKFKISLTRHILHIHKFNNSKKLVSCEICGKQFTQKKLTAHLNYHTRQKLFPCVDCNKMFTFKSGLIKHERIHTGDKPFSCNICYKQFTHGSNLIRHQHIHSGNKPFSCKICNKQFSQSSNLITHQRIHSGDKPFSCSICSKLFLHKSHLIGHKRIHSGDKPYLCKICNKQFSQSSNLITHQRIHSGDKPHSCKICNKQFRQLSTVVKHQRIHSGDKQFSCKIWK